MQTIFPVTSHTKHVGPGSTFVAVKGMKEDGLRYIPQAIAAGATMVVVEHDVVFDASLLALMQAKNIMIQRVENARLALAQLSAQAHGYPSQKLTIMGITGTKGKTTTSFLVEHILRTAGYKTALLSTVHNKILDMVYATELTTQQPDYIHAFLQTCVEKGVTHVVMEVAAQALSLHRVATIQFDYGLFLNFSHEHGEFYATQEDYFAAKTLLFHQLKPQAPVIIPDNDERIISAAQAAGIAGERINYFDSADGSSSLAGIQFAHDHHVYTCATLIGAFNVHNARAAMLVAQKEGVATDDMQNALHTFSPVPGRLNKYDLPRGITAFIDYAHNPSSFEHVLRMMRSATQQLIVVFGAGGDRDTQKRPLMGAIADTYADCVILTTDNPRSENPQAIIVDIKKGIPATRLARVMVELDRERAIKTAYAHAEAGAIIMLLGKGPDEYQLIRGAKTPFSERDILQAIAASEGAGVRNGFTKQGVSVD